VTLSIGYADKIPGKLAAGRPSKKMVDAFFRSGDDIIPRDRIGLMKAPLGQVVLSIQY
jgi:hypothetical protein